MATCTFPYRDGWTGFSLLAVVTGVQAGSLGLTFDLRVACESGQDAKTPRLSKLILMRGTNICKIPAPQNNTHAKDRVG